MTQLTHDARDGKGTKTVFQSVFASLKTEAFTGSVFREL